MPKIKFIDLGKKEAYDQKTIPEEIEEEADKLYGSLSKEEKKEEYDNYWWDAKLSSFANGGEVEGDIWLTKKDILDRWRNILKQQGDYVSQIRSTYGNTLSNRILIIDELLFYGGTLYAALNLFLEAYPSSEVFGVHFFEQKYK